MTKRDSKAADRVEEIVKELDFPEDGEVAEKAKAMAYRAEWVYPINRAPSTIAAGSVYLASLLCNEKRTQQQVSEASDVGIPAIQRAYPEIGEAEGYPMRNHSNVGASDESESSERSIIEGIKRRLKL